jgi:hypothetical protein
MRGHPEPCRRRGTSQYALSKQAKKCAQSRLCEILHFVQDDNAQFAALRKAVVILDSLLIIRGSTLARRDDLRTWFRAMGTTSASEVAKIDNGTNSSLDEEPRSDLGK